MYKFCASLNVHVLHCTNWNSSSHYLYIRSCSNCSQRNCRKKVWRAPDAVVAWTIDMWCELFSKKSQIIGPFGQIGWINCGIIVGYLVYFQWTISTNFVSLSLVHDWLYPNKNYDFKTFNGISLDWDMYLGCKESCI